MHITGAHLSRYLYYSLPSQTNPYSCVLTTGDVVWLWDFWRLATRSYFCWWVTYIFLNFLLTSFLSALLWSVFDFLKGFSGMLAIFPSQDRQGVHVEAEPLCVLDFYIAENLQRNGYGLELFNFMLQVENTLGIPEIIWNIRPFTKRAKNWNDMIVVPKMMTLVLQVIAVCVYW